MSRTLRCIWLAFLLAAAGCGDDTRPDTDTGTDAASDSETATDVPVDTRPTEPADFRVVTWNVENFFDTRNDPDTRDDVLSRSELDQKMEDLARVLRAIDADFVALQEVENLELLEMFNSGALEPLGYTEIGLVDNTFEPRGIDVAFLSRVPVTNVVSHLGEDFDGPTGESQFFTRDALEVFVEPGGFPVLLTIVHFLSMSGDGGDVRRLGEAMQAKRIIDRRIEVSGLTRVAILGDMNDFPSSDPLDALLDDGVLNDITGRVPIEDRWTFRFDGRQQLDYILTTGTLDREVVSVDIMHGDNVDAASDHQPVIAQFRLRP